MPSRLMCQEDFKHLPEITQKEFWKLTKLAYDGVRTQQYIFNNTMMTDIKDNLGLMNDISGFSVSSGTQYTSSFLHTTLQEYLAALYIANKPNNFAKQVFLHVTEQLQKPWIDFTKKVVMDVMLSILNQPSEKNLEVVLVFYAGITEKLQTELDDYIFTATSESEFYSTLFARCIYESPQLSTKYQNRHLLNNWNLSIAMEPLDYYIVGYLISHYNISLDVKIRSGDSYEFITKALPTPPKEPQGQLKLKFVGVFDSDKLFQLPKVIVKGLELLSNTNNSYVIIQATKSFPNLQLLRITSPIISCNKICVHMQTFDYLKELYIYLEGTYEELSSLIPVIQSGRPIKHLQLTLFYDYCPPLHMLFYPSSLERLELHCHPFDVFANEYKIDFNTTLISQNTNLKDLKIGVECPMIIFLLANTTQLRSVKLDTFENFMRIFIFQKHNPGFKVNQYHPCSKICVHLLYYKYLKKLVMAINGTYEEISSIIPLIQPGRPLKHLQLHMIQWTSSCPPSYMLFYSSSLKNLGLFCDWSKYLTCEVNFNTSLISQNINLKELQISVNCPYWDTILLSLATYTSKLRYLITYHYNDHSLITTAANSKLHYHLITLHYLEELAITINGTEKEISSINQLIRPKRPLKRLRLTLVSYGTSPPIHMLLYPSSLEKLELLCYDHVNVKTSFFICDLNFTKNLISQNTNLKELVITTSCPCIDTFSSLLVKTKISTRTYIKDIRNILV